MPSHTRPSAAALRIALGLVSLCGACGGSDGSLVLAREEHLQRQVDGLRRLVRRAKAGALVPTDGVVVAVGEGLVRQLTQLALPREMDLDQGRFHVRLDTVDVGFRNGLGTVRLEGRADWREVPGFPGTPASAELTVYGRVDHVAVDPRAGRLQGAMVPFGFEIHRLTVGEERPRTRRIAAALARTLEEELPLLSMPLVIPIAVERPLHLGPWGKGAVRVRGASTSVRVVVEDVSAYGGRLWLVLRVAPGPWTASPQEVPQ
jgi:hypothetical protein